MKNIIQIDGKKLVECRVGNSKTNPTKYILEDGSEILKLDLRSHFTKIQCVGDQSWYEIKSITSAHLSRPYFGARWRGIHQNPFKGKRHSEDHKRRLSEERSGVWGVGKNNAMYGKTNYDVWLEKFGKDEADRRELARREKFARSISGSSNPFYGKTHNQATIKLIQTKCKNWFSSLTDEQQSEYRTKIRESQRKLRNDDPAKYRELKAKGGKASMMSQMPNWVPNSIEKVVQSELANRGMAFEFGVVLNGHQFDFGNKSLRVLLEVQGDYWHGNPSIYGPDKRPLNEIQTTKVAKDLIKEKFCVQHGFTLFKIWESDIKTKNFDVLDQMRKFIQSKQ